MKLLWVNVSNWLVRLMPWPRELVTVITTECISLVGRYGYTTLLLEEEPLMTRLEVTLKPSRITWMPLAGKVAPAVVTVKLRALVGSKGCVPVGYRPVTTGKSEEPGTSMKNVGSALAVPLTPATSLRVSLPLRVTTAL